MHALPPHPTTTTVRTVLRWALFVQAGHMYKTFAKDSGEAYRQERDSSAAGAAGGATAIAATSPKFVGMHAARCFLGALSGYSGSGWLAAEEYACTVLPTEVRRGLVGQDRSRDRPRRESISVYLRK